MCNAHHLIYRRALAPAAYPGGLGRCEWPKVGLTTHNCNAQPFVPRCGNACPSHPVHLFVHFLLGLYVTLCTYCAAGDVAEHTRGNYCVRVVSPALLIHQLRLYDSMSLNQLPLGALPCPSTKSWHPAVHASPH